MSEQLTRREALRAAAATGAASGLVGAASADGHSNGQSGDGPPRRIVGTTGERGSRAARDEADRVKRSLDFGGVGRAVAGRFSEEAVERLRQRDDVRYVEENGEIRALEQTTPYGISKVDADLAVDDGNTGDGVSVAVIDTGIDAQHEDLKENLGQGYAVVSCSTDGDCDFGSGNDISECLEPWDDDNDHGSHCAGTVGAVDNSTGVLGVAPSVTLHAVKALDRCGSGSYDDIAEGIKWSADQGHEVQSMSLGGDDSSVVRDAVQYAADQNVVMIAAAGNDGPCSDCVGYPAAYPEVIAVSATDSNDDLADFSSTGPEVDLAAPGVDVESTVPRSSYDVFSGTSMACPHVSGGAAQVIASGVTARQEIRTQLKDTADDVGLDENEQGAGRLDVDDAAGTGDGVYVTTGDATDVTKTAATLDGTLQDLDGADSADVYFEWGPGGDLSNTTATRTLSSTGSFDATVDGLSEGTEYGFRAVAESSDGSTNTGPTIAFTTDSDCVDATKWPDGTGRDGGENVDELDLDGQVVEASAANAYEDFTCPGTVAVSRGGSFEVAMAWSDGGYDDHYANVFVDWDGNEDWSTASETVLMESLDDDSVTATTTVDVPSDAPTGSTLVRVRLGWSGFDAAADTDECGEVNDFTVTVE